MSDTVDTVMNSVQESEPTDDVVVSEAEDDVAVEASEEDAVEAAEEDDDDSADDAGEDAGEDASEAASEAVDASAVDVSDVDASAVDVSDANEIIRSRQISELEERVKFIEAREHSPQEVVHNVRDLLSTETKVTVDNSVLEERVKVLEDRLEKLINVLSLANGKINKLMNQCELVRISEATHTRHNAEDVIVYSEHFDCVGSGKSVGIS